jgi:uncharacterized protein YycO
MNTITLVFATRRWNPISWLIRWAVPRSRFAMSRSSHCMIECDTVIYEASMLHGVRCALRDDALAGMVVVGRVKYSVPDADAGLNWLVSQCGKPYDWRGALGLGLTPYRDWAEDDTWYCYELAAGALRAAGRDEFVNLQHIGETALMAIKP